MGIVLKSLKFLWNLLDIFFVVKISTFDNIVFKLVDIASSLVFVILSALLLFSGEKQQRRVATDVVL